MARTEPQLTGTPRRTLRAVTIGRATAAKRTKHFAPTPIPAWLTPDRMWNRAAISLSRDTAPLSRDTAPTG